MNESDSKMKEGSLSKGESKVPKQKPVGRCFRACIRLYDPVAGLLLGLAAKEAKPPATKATELIVAALMPSNEQVLETAEEPREIEGAKFPEGPQTSGPVPTPPQQASGPISRGWVAAFGLIIGLMVFLGSLVLYTIRTEEPQDRGPQQRTEDLTADVTSLEIANRLLEDRIARDERDTISRRLDRIEAAVQAAQPLKVVLSPPDSDPYEVHPLRYDTREAAATPQPK